MADPGGLTFTSKMVVDSKEAEVRLKSMEDRLAAIEKAVTGINSGFKNMASEAENSASRATSFIQKIGIVADNTINIVKLIGKTALTSAAEMALLAKPAVDMDNYLSILNQKISNTGENLTRYRNMIDTMANKSKPGDLDYAFSTQQRRELAFQYAQGSSLEERYGANAEENLSGFQKGVGGLVFGAGMDEKTAATAMTEYHRQLKVTYADMPKFSEELIKISRASSMSSGSLANLIKLSQQLSVVMGKSGEEAQRFSTELIKTSGVLSLSGLDAQDIMGKLTSYEKTGSKDDLIFRMITGFTGFKEGDAKGNLEQIKKITESMRTYAPDTGDSLTDPFTQTLGLHAMRAPFNREELARMESKFQNELSGIPDEKGGKRSPEQAGNELAKSLEEVNKQMSNSGGLFVSMEQTMTNTLAKWDSMIDVNLRKSVDDFKKILQEDVGHALVEFSKKLKDLFPEGIDLKTLAMGVFGAGLVTTLGGAAIKAGIRRLVMGGGGKAVAESLLPAAELTGMDAYKALLSPKSPITSPGKSILGLGAEEAGALGPASLMATEVSAASIGALVATVLVGAAVGGSMGYLFDKLTDKVDWVKKAKEKFFDLQLAGFDLDKSSTGREEITDVEGAKWDKNRQKMKASRGVTSNVDMTIDDVKKLQKKTGDSTFDSLINETAKKYGLDPAYMKALHLGETGGNMNAYNLNKEGNRINAAGPWQLTGTTAKEHGLTSLADRFDPIKSTEAAGEELANLKKQLNLTNDNTKEMTLAYNLGVGGAKRLFDKYGKNWFEHVDEENAQAVGNYPGNKPGGLINRVEASLSKPSTTTNLPSTETRNNKPTEVKVVNNPEDTKTLAEIARNTSHTVASISEMTHSLLNGLQQLASSITNPGFESGNNKILAPYTGRR